MLKKFLCMFAMAVMLVACSSGPTGNSTLDEALAIQEEFCEKIEKPSYSEEEFFSLTAELAKEALEWRTDNAKELVKLAMSEDEADKKAMEIYEKESEKLRERVAKKTRKGAGFLGSYF